jgi:hypothetical protein
MVFFVILVFGFTGTVDIAYWFAIVHDAISLSLMPR